MTDTLLVTWISGFIAKHVALRLRDEVYWVRGTVRSGRRVDEARSANHGGYVDRISFVVADMGSHAGWAEAVRAAGKAATDHGLV